MLENSSNSGHIDRFDRKIIEILSNEGRMTVTELAKRTGLSKTPCQVRLKRLIEQNYISGFRAVINPQKLELGHVAFAEVKLHDTTKNALLAFNEAVALIQEVEQCHMIAGSFDYLLKVRTRDIDAYRHVLGERISALPHVASSSTYVSMQAVKENGF
jgi:Lrp/AsnC family leucine-responsive transcriptional regulator